MSNKFHFCSLIFIMSYSCAAYSMGPEEVIRSSSDSSISKNQAPHADAPAQINAGELDNALLEQLAKQVAQKRSAFHSPTRDQNAAQIATGTLRIISLQLRLN